ncbi:MAG: PDDEXK nuclease domain-containing protein [Eubacterium sp.]|nr:PDDEXK nuclease domain-containing protein [Eubacterium sp.]
MAKRSEEILAKESYLSSAVLEIKELLNRSRKAAVAHVNQELLSAYWHIGEIIVRYEQKEKIRAVYGEATLRQLSKILTKELGKGFSRSNLQNMRLFYQTYQKCQTVSGKLSWSHYCELIAIADSDKRSFYEKECIKSGWSVRELRRQKESMLFERLLLSRGNSNKEQVLSLAQQGVEYADPSDIVREPYVFEFLGLPENKPVMENDLERALIRNLEDFLLELGRGFMFVGTQQRVPVGNITRYVDMVFYNKILKAYVLIELKTKEFMPEAAGQLNMYLNYYKEEVNDLGDNPPIGIILCTDKNNLDVQYALGGLSNQIFVSKYVLYMPKKEQLLAQIEGVLAQWHTQKD